MSRYFPDRNMIPRVKRYVEENQSVNGYVDIDIMVDGLQHQYLDYRRQKKLPFKRIVQDAYEEVRRMLHLEKSSTATVKKFNACSLVSTSMFTF